MQHPFHQTFNPVPLNLQYHYNQQQQQQDAYNLSQSQGIQDTRFRQGEPSVAQSQPFRQNQFTQQQLQVPQTSSTLNPKIQTHPAVLEQRQSVQLQTPVLNIPQKQKYQQHGGQNKAQLARGSVSQHGHSRSRSVQIQLSSRLHPYGTGANTGLDSSLRMPVAEPTLLEFGSSPNIPGQHGGEGHIASAYGDRLQPMRHSSQLMLDHSYPVLPVPENQQAHQQVQQMSSPSGREPMQQELQRSQSSIFLDRQSKSPTLGHQKSRSIQMLDFSNPTDRTSALSSFAPSSRDANKNSSFQESGTIRLPPIQFPSTQQQVPSQQLSFYNAQSLSPLQVPNSSSPNVSLKNPPQSHPPSGFRNPQYRYSLPPFTFPSKPPQSPQHDFHKNEDHHEK